MRQCLDVVLTVNVPPYGFVRRATTLGWTTTTENCERATESD